MLRHFKKAFTVPLHISAKMDPTKQRAQLRERERERESKGEEGRGRERKGEEGRGRERKGEEGRGNVLMWRNMMVSHS